jgi:hypothetical protein
VIQNTSAGQLLRPAAGAQLWVCPAGSPGTPCNTSTTQLFTPLGTQIVNPMAADANGNFGPVCVLTPGRYMLQVGGVGLTTNIVDGIIFPNDPTTPSFGAISGTSLVISGVSNLTTLNVTGTSTLADANLGVNNTISTSNVKQVSATTTFAIKDNAGVAHFSISGTPPFTNTFIQGNGSGATFFGGTAKANFNDTTGAITTAGGLTLQTTSQTLGNTFANDASGGFLATTNGAKVFQFTNAGVFNINNAATTSGAALTVGGTSPTTGGMSIFVGAPGAATETVANYPTDGASGALRIQALSIRTPSGGLLTGTQNAGITNAGVASGLRITPRQIAMTDATSITPTSDTADINTFVSTQAGGTLTVNAPSGTPTDGQKLILRLKSTNAQTYSFNGTYHFSTTVIAPTTLNAGKTDYIGLIWNANNTAWDVVAVDQGH